jgi:ppGpp synthetase/RelA/SpoT-type nucleotidyltranferase
MTFVPTEDFGALYRKSRPSFDLAERSFLVAVNAALKPVITDWMLTSRVKSASSLIRKLRENPREPRTWDSARDKVGLRVICSTKRDCRRATEALEARYPNSDRKDKTGAVDSLYYSGTHLIVEDDGVVDQRGATVPCEIQIRTRAQDAWSVVSHKLLYKGIVEPTERMRRVITRLTVLVELFDDEVHRVFKKRQKLQTYKVGLAAQALESQFERLTGEIPAEIADARLLQMILAAYSDTERDDFIEILTSFWDQDVTGLLEVVKTHQPASAEYSDDRDWLFSQAEILAVLERAKKRPLLLLDRISHTDYEDAIRRCCITAGLTLPASSE